MLTVAFNNSERAFGKNRIKEPWDYTHYFEIAVFAVLAWFTMKFVWPPITRALDERAQKIQEGLAAADKAKADLSLA